MKKKIYIPIVCAVLMISLTACGLGTDSARKEAYKAVIDKWKSDKGTDVIGYEYIYLDDDDIPELVMYCNDEAWSGYDIYTFLDGQAIHLDTYDMDGIKANEPGYLLTGNGRQGQRDYYISGSGILFQQGGMMGSYWVNGYKLENGKLNRIVEYSYTDVTEWSDENAPITYEIRYKQSNGMIAESMYEADIYFENCEELSAIEKEYSFSFDEKRELPSGTLLLYEDAIK
ncbi:MAG: hypothetical protein K6G12_06845 [Lachnospiraceae bacterium]|nr:hypothetical protein [Lachnospiraceae bacterium]